MTDPIKRYIEHEGPVSASAPCRIDMGGTLDIKTIYLPLAPLSPCTFNLALNLRTRVTVAPYTQGRIKVSSRGFDSVEFPMDDAPFDHPLGLMFAIAAFFNTRGIHIGIDSSSPPRSALGGSSAAAMALIAALSVVPGIAPDLSTKDMVLTAHALEESVARVPCGLQDQLAAGYGGVHAWYWQPSAKDMSCFERRQLLTGDQYSDFESCFLVAYCGIPHESKDINSQWIDHFLTARNRDIWRKIVTFTNGFVEAVQNNDIGQAVAMMNEEVAVRQQITPGVFDDMGLKLIAAAREKGCGARFTGAGGGGCIWALGSPNKIDSLKGHWQEILDTHAQACLLDTKIDGEGIKRA